jgi:predicted acylesterase/phospholipase RssA
LSDGWNRADSLASVPMFAGMAAETEAERDATPLAASPWAALATSATPQRLQAGDWLWHEGDDADSLYVVLTGRLEVVVEQPLPKVVRVLARGGAVGELALLTDSPRSAGVRARRDSELLKVSREAFTQLLDERPEFAVALTRVLGRQLRDAQQPAIDANPMPATIAIVPLGDGLPLRDIASYLSLILSGWHSVATLDGSQGDDPAAWAALLDRTERDNDQVLLVATSPDPKDPWTRFCERQADRTIALARGGEQPRGLADRMSLRACELVMVDPQRHKLDPWLDALAPRNAHVVAGGAAQAPVVESLARRLAGRSLGLVLSGGGARAFAHIGVLEELLARGLTVDRVAGCSGGAFVGGMFAQGRSPAEILSVCRREFVERSPMDDYTVPLVAVTRGIKGVGMVKRVFGDATIEELQREYFCVSTDMLTSELVIHRRGSLAEAASASMTLPGVFPPRPYGSRLLLDGGLLNNLPVDVMAAEGEGPVIASDVSARFEAPVVRPPNGRRRIADLRAQARAWLVGSGEPLPSLPETIVRSIVLGSADTAAAAQRYADVVIEPEVAHCGLLEWKKIDALVEAGREAAAKALAAAPAGFGR